MKPKASANRGANSRRLAVAARDDDAVITSLNSNIIKAASEKEWCESNNWESIHSTHGDIRRQCNGVRAGKVAPILNGRRLASGLGEGRAHPYDN
jgi:hypothetical protein